MTKINDSIKDDLKVELPDYLSSKGIDFSKNFTCLNPNHADHTPSMTYYKDDQTVYCHGCGAKYDIFDLYAIDNLNAFVNTDARASYNFAEAYNGVATLYGMDVSKIKVSPESALNSKINQINAKMIENAKKNLEQGAGYLQRRGISLDLAKKYGLGFIEKWVNPTTALKEKRELKSTPRLIVPTSGTSYLARDTRKIIPDSEKPYQKQKQGNAHLFNGQALLDDTKPIFVTEGEFDALSILQVTNNASAVGLGSTSHINLFIDILQRVINQKLSKHQKYNPTILIALDNDDAGKLASTKLAVMLNKINIENYSVDILNGYKDENEALVKTPDKFKSLIEQRIKDPNDYLNQYRKRSQKLHEKPNYIPTGFKAFDTALNGGLQPMLYVLGAISALGKTTYALQIADKLAQNNTPVLFFELEMTRRELTSKILSRITSDIANKTNSQTAQTAQDMNLGLYLDNSASTKVVNQAFDYFSKYYANLHIYDSTNGRPTVKNIYNKVDDFCRKYPQNKPLIIVDYLQILKPINDSATDKAQVTESVAKLKEIASVFQVPVLVISSLNRASYTMPINMSAFKESGEIEYYADVLLGMQLSILSENDRASLDDIDQAKQARNREIDIKILKNRSGAYNLNIKFIYIPKYNFFIERPNQDKMQQY